MIMIIQAFLLNLINNGLSTVKTIYIHKEKYLSGAFYNAFSTFFYLIAVVQIAKSNNIYSIIAMCFATFLGTYLPGTLMKKSERDKLFIFNITASNFETGLKFADEVRNMNIPVKTNISYNSKKEKVITCEVYCLTKEESRIINGLIPKDFKYHIYTPLITN